MFSWGLSIFLSLLFALMSVAFVTLFERKILAFSQMRVGPNKILLKGVLQPVIDGIKLLHKSIIPPLQALKVFIFLGPLLVLMGMMMVWSCLSSLPLQSSFWLSSFFFFLVLSFGVYGVLLTGLSSSSKYGFLGGMRACIQSVSYEISLALIVFFVVLLVGRSTLIFWQSISVLLLFPPWVFSVVAETNRAPFDLAEGESELISGLNIELGNVFLAFLFVGEYGMVVCFAWFTSLMFLGGGAGATMLFLLLSLFFRSVFPRFRYDKLLSFCWICLLPVSVAGIFLSISISSF